jgi:hypothetical protein
MNALRSSPLSPWAPASLLHLHPVLLAHGLVRLQAVAHEGLPGSPSSFWSPAWALQAFIFSCCEVIALLVWAWARVAVASTERVKEHRCTGPHVCLHRWVDGFSSHRRAAPTGAGRAPHRPRQSTVRGCRRRGTRGGVGSRAQPRPPSRPIARRGGGAAARRSPPERKRQAWRHASCPGFPPVPVPTQ